ncbi:biliverdin-producing heme oxygenase [Brevundimonas sp.]|uniref:biliverdin-producing heme oxygenase n=1 Tax=Brevundimonas sp. TaxID=1871086 RepID=UPI00289CC0B3|nr:biliverdin-producing heme oxygenase [Brevundimonas sp.]
MADTMDMPRSKRLKALTHEIHDRLDKSIMEASSFDSLEGYGRFAGVQWTFHRDIDALYDDAGVITLLPGLAERRRMDLIAIDLADIGLATPLIETPPVFLPDQPTDTATALGWLYVAEGSNLGAALLRKEAAKLGLSDIHGARHLAPSGGGPAAHWRVFTAALDAAVLTSAEEDRAVAGAKAAFARVQALANAALC